MSSNVALFPPRSRPFRDENRERYMRILKAEIEAVDREMAQLAHRKWLKALELASLKEQRDV